MVSEPEKTEGAFAMRYKDMGGLTEEQLVGEIEREVGCSIDKLQVWRKYDPNSDALVVNWKRK